MDYEKKYKEALDKASVWHQQCIEGDNTSRAERLENLFPELKDIEDERIRKDIIVLIKDWWDRVNKDNISTKEQMIAWLERQNEIGKVSYEIAEKEKREFVGDGFIKCYADFQDFKEGETYRLEYVGDDLYNVRSDNLLGKTYHITPCQLYTVFKKLTWLEKKGEQKPADGTFVNVDDVREDFVQEVYRVLDADSTNDRANQIIDAFDNLPTVTIEVLNGEKVDNANKVEPRQEKLTEFEKAVKQVWKKLLNVAIPVT